VLKYLVLTTMLMKSNINPFDSQETKPYKNDPRISAMTDLVDAFQRDDIHSYEAILRENQDVLADPFIAENIDEVSRNMRTKAVLKLIYPYTRFSLAFISKQIKISVPEVQDILSFLILDRQLIDAKIDQESGTVVVKRGNDHDRMQALDAWRSELDSLWQTVLSEGDGFKMEETSRLHASIANTNFALGMQKQSSSGLGSMVDTRSKTGWKGKAGLGKVVAGGF